MPNDKNFKTVKTGPITSDQPEPEWIHDLPIDNVVGAMTALAAEIHILRERQRAMERELERRDLVPAGAIETHNPTGAERKADQKELEAFTKRFWSEITRSPRQHAAHISPGVERFLRQPE